MSLIIEQSDRITTNFFYIQTNSTFSVIADLLYLFRKIISMENPRYALIRRQDKEQTTAIYEIYDLLKDDVIKRIALVSDLMH